MARRVRSGCHGSGRQAGGVKHAFKQRRAEVTLTRVRQHDDDGLARVLRLLGPAQGSGRGGKPKEETIKGNTLALHQGKRARKGRKVEGLQKVLRVVA